MKALNALALLAILLGCANGHGQNTFKNDPLLNSSASPIGEKMLSAPIPVVGVHHYGRGHHIGEFSIDGRSCGNAGTPEKNSGSDTMCRVSLPAQWRPGIKFKVKWGLTNWNEDLSALQKGNSGRWYEAEAEVERYQPVTGAVEVHFWPDNSIRLVADPYGPPDSDTRPDQTPPLTELPVYEPGWYGLGGLRAAFKHEGKYGDDLRKFEANREAYYAFLQRLWTSRGLSEQQKQVLLTEEQEKERQGIRSGHLTYLVELLEKQGMNSNAAFEASRPYRHVSQEALDQHITEQLSKIKNK